jgi:hypothetical protein
MTQLLTEAEAAQLLRIGERTLRELRRDRKIRYVAITARKIAYRLEDCEEYIASCVRLDSAERGDARQGQGKGGRGRARPAAPMRTGDIVPFSQRKRA